MRTLALVDLQIKRMQAQLSFSSHILSILFIWLSVNIYNFHFLLKNLLPNLAQNILGWRRLKHTPMRDSWSLYQVEKILKYYFKNYLHYQYIYILLKNQHMMNSQLSVDWMLIEWWLNGEWMKTGNVDFSRISVTI